MLRLTTSRKFIIFGGMGNRFYGISSDADDLRHTMEKAIEEKMQKIVEVRDKEHQQKMDEFKTEIAKMFATQTEQFQKQMAQQTTQIDEMKKTVLACQQKKGKEYDGNLNCFGGKWKNLFEKKKQSTKSTSQSIPLSYRKSGRLDVSASEMRFFKLRGFLEKHYFSFCLFNIVSMCIWFFWITNRSEEAERRSSKWDYFPIGIGIIHFCILLLLV